MNGYTVQTGTNIATDSASIKTDNVTFNLGGHLYGMAGKHATTALVVGLANADSAKLTVTNGTVSRNGWVAADPGATGLLTVTSTGRVQTDEDLKVGTGTATLQIDRGGSVHTGTGLVVLAGGQVRGSGSIEGVLQNQTGIVAPGTSAAPGILSIMGQFVQQSAGILQIRLGGTNNSNPLAPQFDQLAITGLASLGGTLNVSLINSFTPVLGNSFTIINVDSGISGIFSTITLPALNSGLEWRTLGSTLLVATDLAGDYNGNGEVDAADYVTWRYTLGQHVTAGQAADGDGDGVVDQADFNVWRSHFGQQAGPGSWHR